MRSAMAILALLMALLIYLNALPALGQDARVKESFGPRGVTDGVTICWQGTDGMHGKNCVSGGSYVGTLPKRRPYIRVTTGTCTTTSGCTAAIQNETSTNDINYFTASFANAATQCWQVDFGLPANFSGTTLTAGIEWTPTTGTTTGNVVWRVRMLALANDEALDTALGTGVNVTDTFIAVGDLHQAPESGAVTPAGSPVGGEHLWIDVCRLGSDGGDTLDGAAELMGLFLSYSIDHVSAED